MQASHAFDSGCHPRSRFACDDTIRVRVLREASTYQHSLNVLGSEPIGDRQCTFCSSFWYIECYMESRLNEERPWGVLHATKDLRPR